MKIQPKIHLIALCFIVSTAAASALYVLPTVSSQKKYDAETKSADSDESPSILAKGRGFPRINFEDGRELGSSGGKENGSAQTRQMASADFDSDGVPDLITVDASGGVRFHKGNVDSIFPNSGEAEERKASGTSVDSPFFAGENLFSMAIAADYLEAGDFNADGHADILAAARGGSSLFISVGDGTGRFVHTTEFTLPGSITALAVGEIGRADGQADVALAVTGSYGSNILVFENPYGAFSHPPEVLELNSPTKAIAIGDLDHDAFADIAVAGESKLTIIRGRGHTQPWDRLETKIARPAAIVETRILPFEVADISVGRFSKGSRDSVAILTTDGAIATISCPEKAQRAKVRSGKAVEKQYPLPVAVETMEKGFSKYADYQAPTKLVTDLNEVTGDLRILEAGKRWDELKPVERAIKSPPDTTVDIEKIPSDPESNKKAKENFILANSPARAPALKSWRFEIGFRDAKLISTASRPESRKMIKVRVSTSGREDLVLFDNDALHVLLWPDEKRGIESEIVTFDAAGTPTAVLPMRLNEDALSDLVIIQEGSTVPSVLLTAPVATYTVNSTADSNTCSGGTCTLRGAIMAANASFGADLITFAVGPGSNFSPATTYPTISETVTINGATAPGYFNQPVVQISGTAPLGANGFAINAPNCVIRAMSITRFRMLISGSTTTGGFGITIFNFLGDEDTVNTIVEGNFLGVDLTGSGDAGNEAAGLQIFDSDFNIIGGNTALAKNVISGNGNGEIANGNRSAPGILVIDGKNNVIRGNHIGVNSAGTAALSNSVGIFLTGSNNEIGGDPAGSTNVVSGNRHSIPDTVDAQACRGDGITEATAYNKDTDEFITHDNRFKGNRIGTNAAGTQGIGNCRSGIKTNQHNSPTIGSITSVGRNTVSGNSQGGIWCSTRAPYDVAFSPNAGIRVPLGDDPPDPDEPVPPVGFCKVSGNNVGTDAAGNVSIPNNIDKTTSPFAICDGDGLCLIFLNVWGNILVDSTDTFSTIGEYGGTTSASCTGLCNLVSGNRSVATGYKVFIEYVPAITAISNSENTHIGEIGVFSNYVGTNISGTAALSNPGGGIAARGRTRIGEAFTDIGGIVRGMGNLVSGNTGIPFNDGTEGITTGGSYDGIEFDYTIVRNNRVGTDRTGTTAIPNDTAITTYGNGSVAIIGGDTTIDRNIVSGNLRHGIVMGGLSSPTRNNYIGVNANGDPLGNGGSGVVLIEEFDRIGDAGVGNVIANNGGSGVLVVRRRSSGAFPRGNRIRFNNIYNNGGLGIDLSMDNTYPWDGDGVTFNDCDDPDVGPHRLQNYPILTAPQFNGDGTVTVGGAFDSTPSTAFTLDFYSNSAADPSGYGEGETYIGSASVTTDDGGIASFLFTSSQPVSPGTFITATAFDIDGNTSEFSCVAGQCSLFGATLEEQLESARAMAGGGCEIGIIVNISTDEPDPNPADGICDVDLGTTGPQCSLRAAIETANAVPGTNFIGFDIPGAGIHTITPSTELPVIVEKVLINAKTQPGHVDRPLIEVNGSGTGLNSNGFVFAVGSDDSTLSGFTINRFGNAGVLIQANNVKLEHNFLGVFSDGIGEDPSGRQRRGIKITGANNIIGGTRSDPETSVGGNNVIVGNSVEQIWITGAGATGNKVYGNAIGFTLADDPRNRVEEADGIRIDDGAGGNRIGGGDILERNVIQGQFGIWLRGSNDNLITNNGIGNSVAGIAIFDSANNTIGGTRNFEDGIYVRNLIANSIYGIFMTDTPEIENAELERLFIPRNPEATDKECKEYASLPEIPDDPPDELTGVTIATRNNRVMGNLIGIRNNDDPREDYSNCLGIVLHVAEENSVGGDEGQFLNFISGNAIRGVVISARGTNNTVQRNYIGTDRTGREPFPNLSGIIIRGNNNLINNNVIAGNTEAGVLIEPQLETDPYPTGNRVLSNRVGISQSDDTIVPNTTGIYVNGTLTTVHGNEVSGNSLHGIYVLNHENTISNNLIGTDRFGNSVRPNTEFGILITSSNNNIFDNLISGNGSGVTIARAPKDPNMPADNNRLERNYIGTNSAGTEALPGQLLGIVIANGASSNIIGGTGANVKNVISGHTGTGIVIQPGVADGATAPRFNKIQGNYIGTDASGTAAIPNAFDGIDLDGASQTLVGGFESDMPAARNLISGNGRNGIYLHREALLNRISGNYIGTQADGTSPLGNVGNGIRMGESTTGTIVGGPEANAGNTIGYNGSNGISLTSDAGNNNIIDPNSIFANVLMGIDIGEDGPTPNDPGDADVGPNKLQNYPVITSKQVVNDDLIIQFKVDSAPEHSAYGANGIYVEFFKAGAGSQGETYIGFAYYRLGDYMGESPGTKTVNLGNAAALGADANTPITATATDADGNTSEFAPAFGPNAAGVEISGRVMDARRRPIHNVTVTITSMEGGSRSVRTSTFGFYKFFDVEAGQSYILQAAAKRYSFDPMIISLDDTLTGLDIVAR